MTLHRQSENRQTPREMAHEILCERDVIKNYFEHVYEFRDRVAEYGAKYGMSSDQVHTAIENGHIDETDEVCDWIMTYELLERSNAIAAG